MWAPLGERVAQDVEEGGLTVSRVDFVVCEAGSLTDGVPAGMMIQMVNEVHQVCVVDLIGE